MIHGSTTTNVTFEGNAKDIDNLIGTVREKYGKEGILTSQVSEYIVDVLDTLDIVFVKKISDTAVELTVDESGGPDIDIYDEISKTFSLQYVLRSTDPDYGVYINTDSSGKYYKEKYFIDDGNEYLFYSNAEEMIRDFRLSDFDVNTVEEIKKICSEDKDMVFGEYREE